MRNKLSEVQIANIVVLYDGGRWNTVTLADMYDVSVQQVANVLKAEGIQLRKTGYKDVVAKHGYIKVMVNKDDPIGMVMADSNRYCLKHRLVMAHFLGRVLLSTETVHHIDGDRKNNDIANLQLRTGNHGPGVVYKCCDCGSVNVSPDRLAESMVE